MQRFRDYLSLVMSNEAEDVYNEVDFTIRRVNFQSNASDRHIYQSYRAMPPFWKFLTFTTASSLSLIWTRIMKKRPDWTLGRHFNFSMVIGTTAALVHNYFVPPYQIGNICNWDDNYYSMVMRQVINARPNKEKWYSALQLEEKHDVQRLLWTVPNFQLSGHPAVISTDIYQDPPDGADELSEEEFLSDIFKGAQQYHESKKMTNEERHALTEATQGRSRLSLKELNNNINLFMQIHGIDRPRFIEQYDDFVASIQVQRPADFLHVHEKPKAKNHKDGLGALPPNLQSPYDFQSVVQTRRQMQAESNQKIHEIYAARKERKTEDV